MLKFSRADFKELFRGKYDHAKWIDAMCAVFGPLQLKRNPEELEIGLKGNDCGWFLGRFTAASQGGDMEVGVFRYRIDSKSVLKSRVGLRNLVRPYVRDYSSLGAALVVFEDAKTGEWRFSFVSDLKGGETAAKRYTYVFGEADGVYNTPADRFAKLAEGRPADGFVTFEQMREAFSVEALSKEFYNRLFAWYQWAMDEERIHVTFPNKVGDLLDDRKGLNVAMIRLLTRILFCWFIKQKKLVPDELFDVEYLKGILRAFEHEKHEEFEPLSETQGTYYNAILQNLFFATLNREIIDDDGKRRAFANAKSARDVRNLYRYREMFKFASGEVEKKVISLFAKVPFLNGGLFECLDKFKKFDLMQDDDEYLDGFSRNFTSYKVGEHRHYRYIAHVPNVLFFSEDEKELGLINLLKAYNFTIEENASNDAEVSLDPELLGRVFENLLADYNEETQKSARNATGSFYTPREIVDYQVAESLSAYLSQAAEAESSVVRDFVIHRVKPADAELCRQLEEALLSVKILDPACGSGAYPMGCLLKIVDLIDCLRDGKCNHYTLKLKLIDKAIYGIDIQPIAMLITKLRFFISLICDQKEITDDEKTNFGVKPLPNLETKFVAANSLISLETNDMFELEDKEVSTLRQQLLEVRERHFAASTTRGKKKLRGEDEQIRGKMIKRLTEIASKPDKQKLAFYQKELQKLEKSLDNLIANGFETGPKFEQTTFFEEPEPNQSAVQTQFPINAAFERRKKDLTRRINDLKKRIDVENGRKMTAALKEDASNLAQWNPYDQNDIAGFFDPYWMFGLKDGFDIIIGNPPYIRRTELPVAHKMQYERHYFSAYGQYDIYLLFIEFGLKSLRKNGHLCYINPLRFYNSDYGLKARTFIADKYRIKSILDVSQLKVFESAMTYPCVMLYQNCNEDLLENKIEYRRLPELDDIDAVHEIEPVLISQAWIQKDNEKRFLMCNRTELDMIDKIGALSTSVGRVFSNARGLANSVVDFDGRRYKALKSKGVRRYFIDDTYIRNVDAERGFAFSDEMVIMPRTVKRIIMTVKPAAIVLLDRIYYLTPRNPVTPAYLRFVVGTLNSAVTDYWFQKLYETTKVSGGYFDLNGNQIESMPIPNASEKQQSIVAAKVDAILAAKNANPDADTSALESEIDDIVFDLYGLTAEERALVRGAGK